MMQKSEQDNDGNIRRGGKSKTLNATARATLDFIRGRVLVMAKPKRVRE